MLPHVEIVVGTGIELERDSSHPVEHNEGDEHVGDVGERPRRLLRDPRDDVIEDLQGSNQDEMDGPGTCLTVSLGQIPGEKQPAHSPLALTQLAFRFGRAAWSLDCSMDSGGSW